jgi:hypothetical protein
MNRKLLPLSLSAPPNPVKPQDGGKFPQNELPFFPPLAFNRESVYNIMWYDECNSHIPLLTSWKFINALYNSLVRAGYIKR